MPCWYPFTNQKIVPLTCCTSKFVKKRATSQKITNLRALFSTFKKMQQDNCQNNFLCLPLELLDYIIQYNNAQDVVFAISVSCKALSSMTRNIDFLKRKIVQFHHQVLHALVQLSMNKHHVSELQALLYYFLRQFGMFVNYIYMLDLPVQMVATEQDGRIQEDEVRQLAKLDKQAREIVFSSNRSIFFRHFDINLQASKPIVLAQQLGCFFYEMTFLKYAETKTCTYIIKTKMCKYWIGACKVQCGIATWMALIIHCIPW